MAEEVNGATLGEDDDSMENGVEAQVGDLQLVVWIGKFNQASIRATRTRTLAMKMSWARRLEARFQ
jgi:hypothetical protein